MVESASPSVTISVAPRRTASGTKRRASCRSPGIATKQLLGSTRRESSAMDETDDGGAPTTVLTGSAARSSLTGMALAAISSDHVARLTARGRSARTAAYVAHLTGRRRSARAATHVVRLTGRRRSARAAAHVAHLTGRRRSARAAARAGRQYEPRREAGPGGRPRPGRLGGRA